MILIYLILGLLLVFIGYNYMYKIYEEIYKFEVYLDDKDQIEFKKYFNERYKVYLFSLIYSSIISYFFYIYLIKVKCSTKFIIIPYLALFIFIQIFIISIFQYTNYISNILNNKDILMRWKVLNDNIMIYFIIGNIFSLLGYGLITFYILKLNIMKLIF